MAGLPRSGSIFVAMAVVGWTAWATVAPSSAQMYQSNNSFGPVGYTGFNTPAGGGGMNGVSGTPTPGSSINQSQSGGNNLGVPASNMGGQSNAVGAPTPKKPVSSSLKRRRATTASTLGDPSLANEEVVDVRIVGVQGVSLQKIAPEVKTRAGRPFDPDGIEEDVRRLTKTRLFVSVDTTYQRTPTGVIVIYRVVERPTVKYLKFVGNTVRERTVRKHSGLKVGDSLDPYMVAEGRRKLEDWYVQHGYAKCKVSIVEGDKPGDSGVVLLINEGTKQRIYKVQFVGNMIASDGRLKTQVKSKIPLLYIFKGEVDREKIDKDVDLLTQYYRSLGFFRARIGRELEFNEKQNWVTLTFVIDEGPRYKIREISLMGNKHYKSDDLLKEMNLASGKYFDQKSMEKDVTFLQNRYGSVGYIFANIEADPRFDEEPGQLDLVYQIQEGDRYRVGRIDVRIAGDNPRTRRHTVLNRVSIYPGDIADLRELRDSERRLRGSGLFANKPAEGKQPVIKFKRPGLEDIEDSPDDSGGESSTARRNGSGGGRRMRGQSPDPASTDPHDRVWVPPPGCTDKACVLVVDDGSIPLEPESDSNAVVRAQSPDDSALASVPRAEVNYRGQSPTYPSGNPYPNVPQSYTPPNMAPPATAGQMPMGRTSPDSINSYGSSAGQPNSGYVQPVQYTQGAPAGGQPLFNAPPPSAAPAYPQAGQPPAYNTAPPAYGAPPPGYSNQPPAYGSQPPAYNTQPPTYGGQAPAYGSPPPAYGSQPPAYGGQPPAYANQAPAYNGQPPAYGGQPPGSSQPPLGYVNPPPGFSSNPNAGVQAPAFAGQPQAIPPGTGPGQVYQPGGPGQGGVTGPPVGAENPDELFPQSSGIMQDPSILREAPVDVMVEETQTGRFMVGVGVNSAAGLIGSITIDEQNFDIRQIPTSLDDWRNGTAFRGAGQGMRLEAMPGTVLSRYSATFREPYLFDTRINFALTGFYFQRYYPSWTEQRAGGRVSLGYQFTPDLSGMFAIGGQSVKIENPQTPTPPELESVLGRNPLYTADWTLIHDTRDSTFMPTEGHYVNLTLTQGFGHYDYPRAVIDARRHFLIHERPDRSGRQTLTFLTTLGFTGNNTPMFENFFAGGLNGTQTLRGFYFRGASPQDMNVFVGGKFEWINTVEYMFPLMADDMLKGVVFCDYGTVETNTSLHWSNYRISPGFGLRIQIPAMGPAPIALDIAAPVHHAVGDQIQNFSFFVGYQR